MIQIRKKAQGISVNVIIIAAIGLAVLVVMFATFTGRMGKFSKGVNDAEAALSCNDQCQIGGYLDGHWNSEGKCTTDHARTYGKFNDVPTGSNQVCCCTERNHN